MYEYWNQESNLPSNTLDRLTQLLVTLYSKKTETQFLYHATNLLLELTSRSPDYNRVLFDTPLSECKFEVRNVYTSFYTYTNSKPLCSKSSKISDMYMLIVPCM